MRLQLQLRDEKSSTKTLLQEQIPSLVSKMKVELDSAIKKGGERAPNLAKIFIDGIGKHGNTSLAKSEKGPVLVVGGSSVNIAHPIAGRDVEQAIQAMLYRLEQPANEKTVDSIRSVIMANATHGDGIPNIQVYEYNAPSEDGGVFLDMRRGDGGAVKISSSGISDAPENEGVTFVYDGTLGARPAPLLGTKLHPKLKHYMSNVENHDFWLLVGYVTFAWCHPAAAGLTMPMLQLFGSAGQGKTTLTKLLMTLMAPREDLISGETGKYQDIMILAQSDRVIAIDNTGVADRKTSDLMCSASTGSSVKVRQLYTTSGMVTMRLHNFIITNGILGMAGRHDLLSRAIPLKVVKPKSQFPSDTAIMEEFTRDLPAIFSWLLQISAKCLQLKDQGEIKPPVSKHRARDFVNWIASLEHLVYNKKGEDKVNLLQLRLDALMEMSMDDVAEQNHVVSAVLEFMEDQDEWRGTPSDLHEQLTDIPDFAVVKGRSWPNSAAAMTAKLKQDESLLTKKGISIEFGRGKERWVRLINENPPLAEIPSSEKDNAVEAMLN